jgi:glucose-6-phosphate 1-epimerase
MVTTQIPDRLRRFEIPGRVSLMEGNGELTKLEVFTEWSTAEIYMQGAQITDFQKKGEPPMLFTSQVSRFASRQPIRGGIPIVFPWFGPREGEPMHGFARISEWDLHEAVALPDGGATLRFSLPEAPETAVWPAFSANYVVTITDRLQMELIITNASPDDDFTFESCLHSYFAVGDIHGISIVGLKGASYLDKADHFALKTEADEAIQITSEVDRTYLDTPGPVEILDPKLRRKIRIEKSGANSTVVWNPWVTKSQQMPDFGNEEYKQMVCIEPGNIGRNKVMLPPGKSAAMKIILSSDSL